MTIDQTNQQILEHLSNGLTAKEIAVKVFLSCRTVELRIQKMRKKTASKNSVQLIDWFNKNCKLLL